MDDLLEKVRTLNPYSPVTHMEMIQPDHSKPNVEGLGLDDRLEMLHEYARPMSDYLSMHPQIYLYPTQDEWRYLLFDPKHLRRMDNDEYYENLGTGMPPNTALQTMYEMLHEKYPTALLDYYKSEEEMLRDQ